MTHRLMPRTPVSRGPVTCRRACLLVGLLIAGPALADSTGYAPTQSDWGGAGLWQTPTARMADPGEIAFTASRASPYTRFNFTLQPYSWLEGIIRYTSVSNRRYGPASLSGHQSYKDKSIDAKVRLWRESRWVPTVAVGIRDLGGTGLFSGEYVVGSKRFGPLDASFGLAWGYMGARGDIANPLGLLSSRFDTRPTTTVANGGNFNSNHYFRGRAAFFGGFSYQTPWQRLVLKMEYEGNNYQHEPQDNNQPQRTPINVGAVYRWSRHVDLSAAFERGNTAMLSLTLHANLAEDRGPPKLLNPPPPPRPVQPATHAPNQVDWADVSRQLESNAGVRVSRIAQRGRELVVTGEQTRYFYRAQGVGRTARILDNVLGPGIDWYTLESTREGLPVVDTSVDRYRFDALLDHRMTLDRFHLAVEQDPPTPEAQKVLYRAPLQRYQGGASITYGQTLGGPNAFILYQIAANYDANFHFTPNLWWSGDVSANLINNYSKFTYDAPSNLPRVRTHVREYLTTHRVTLPVFQLTATRRLGEDWYGMAYAGMLESMYGGAGGEVMYRPFGERWAIGADANWVKQRGYGQDFSFLPYHVVTGHVTAYLDTGLSNTTLAISAGRYLAGDWGTTINVSREFHNGVRMGAYATFTTADGAQYGEGSFDKGIYISIPFDLLLPRSTVNRAYILWQPLYRDGGARLNRRYALYTLTDGRNSDNFNNNLDTITH